MVRSLSLFFLLCCFFISGLFAQDSQAPLHGIVIHGGAGTLLRDRITPAQDSAYRAALTRVLGFGDSLLRTGAPALDVVEQCIWIMEDSPLFNAGRGAVYNHEGKVELDASIMDGSNRAAGAVTGVDQLRHPISAARVVMERSGHVLLAGEGAEKFALDQGLEAAKPEWFENDRRRQQWQRAIEREKATQSPNGDQGALPGAEQDWKYGTVGVAVLDVHGNLAAGTSTGGMTNKKYGRIGDSPIVGAGTFADNATCAISCTGHGEYFIRYVVAHDIAARMAYKGLSLQDAAREVVQKTLKPAGGTGGVIGIDRNGNIALEFNTPGMYRGFLRSTDPSPKVAIYRDE